jgi:hypothetical protein
MPTLPAHTFLPTSYLIRLFTPQNVPPSQGAPPVVARIHCILAEPVENGVSERDVLVIYFIASGSAVPLNAGEDIKAPADQLVWYLDLLRNERVLVFVDSDHPEQNRLWAIGKVGWGHVS